MSNAHLSKELAESLERVHVDTRYGQVTGRRATNGAAVFLGAFIFGDLQHVSQESLCQ